MTNTPSDPGDSTSAFPSAFASTSPSAFGQQMLNIATNIHRCGFMLVMVGSGDCSVPGCECEPSDERWSYSIGMVERGMPEVVITGLADVHALYVANFVFDEFRAGRGMEVGEVRWMGSAPLRLDDVDDEWLATDTNRMAHWLNHYCVGRTEIQMPPVRQIVWGDSDGYFPDDSRCDPTIAAWQPVLADDPVSFPTPSTGDEGFSDDGFGGEGFDERLKDEIQRMFQTEQHPSRDRRRRRN